MVTLPDAKPILTDSVVTLRRFTIDDVPDVARGCEDPEIVRWTASIPSPYTEDHARQWIDQHDRQWANGTIAHFAVCDASSGAFLGSMSLVGINWERRSAVAAYWAGSWARGKGFTTRALQLLCDWAFDTLGLEQIDLMTVIGNFKSERVAIKAGFAVVNELDFYQSSTARDPNRRYEVKHWSRCSAQ